MVDISRAFYCLGLVSLFSTNNEKFRRRRAPICRKITFRFAIELPIVNTLQSFDFTAASDAEMQRVNEMPCHVHLHVACCL